MGIKNEDKLKMLNDENIETLTFAFADTLKQLKNEKTLIKNLKILNTGKQLCYSV